MKKKNFYGLLLILTFGILELIVPYNTEAITAEIKNPLSVQDFNDLLLKITKGVGTLIGVLGGLMITVAGILYITSTGKPEGMKRAQTALIYAIIGIAIGIASNAIVNTILDIIKE